MSEELKQIARDFLNEHKHLAEMVGGDYNVDLHDQNTDSHVVGHLDGVDESHIDKDPYHVVTINKDITTEDGSVIPRTVKIEIDQDNNIKNVLESK